MKLIKSFNKMADSSTTFSQDAVEARSLLNELGEIFKSLKDENTKFKKDINDIHQRTAPRLESEQVIENDNDVNDIVDIDESDNDVIDEDKFDHRKKSYHRGNDYKGKLIGTKNLKRHSTNYHLKKDVDFSKNEVIDEVKKILKKNTCLVAGASINYNGHGPQKISIFFHSKIEEKRIYNKENPDPNKRHEWHDLIIKK